MKKSLICFILLSILVTITVAEVEYEWITLKWVQTVFANGHVSVTFLTYATNISWNVFSTKPCTIYLMHFDDYNKLKFGKPFNFYLSVKNSTNYTGQWDNAFDIASGIALGIVNEGEEQLECVSTVSQYIPVGLNGVTIALLVIVCLFGLSLVVVCCVCTCSGNLALFDSVYEEETSSEIFNGKKES